MKALFIFLMVFSISMLAFGKKDKDVDMKDFSKALNESITERLDQNPQSYETKPVSGRTPASVGPVEIVEPVPVDGKKDLDKFDPQNVGHDKL